MNNHTWRDRAACAEVTGEIFFPIKQGPGVHFADMAKSVCAVCPVVAACLRYALEADETEGVWGNTTPEERRALRHQQAALAGTIPGDGVIY